MSPTWRPAYIAIGSNLNDPRAQVLDAYGRVAALPGVRLIARSRLYESAPMGPQDQPRFVNAAAGVLAQGTARELLNALLSIERAMGRDRRERWGPRIIDLDLIWMVGAPVEEPGLSVPHPGVAERNFVLVPLGDIAPTLYIPAKGRVSDLVRRAGDSGLSMLDENGLNL